MSNVLDVTRRVTVMLLTAAFVILVLYFAAVHVKAAPAAQRFVRVGWDVIELAGTRQTVIDTIKDTKTGTCKAFYRIEYTREMNMTTGNPAIALSDFGFVNCDGQTVILPLVVTSPIK